MKKYYFTFLIFIFGCSLFSQVPEKNAVYQKDTLQGRHFGNYIKPVNGFKMQTTENTEAAYFKKCANFKAGVQRNQCFSDVFYEVIRKKVSFQRNASDKTEIDLLVQFTINELGVIGDISFPKSNDKSGIYEKEVMRVMKKMPEMLPARLNGVAVGTLYSFPIQVKPQ